VGLQWSKALKTFCSPVVEGKVLLQRTTKPGAQAHQGNCYCRLTLESVVSDLEKVGDWKRKIKPP
jgi:hypothetical protein